MTTGHPNRGEPLRGRAVTQLPIEVGPPAPRLPGAEPARIPVARDQRIKYDSRRDANRARTFLCRSVAELSVGVVTPAVGITTEIQSAGMHRSGCDGLQSNHDDRDYGRTILLRHSRRNCCGASRDWAYNAIRRDVRDPRGGARPSDRSPEEASRRGVRHDGVELKRQTNEKPRRIRANDYAGNRAIVSRPPGARVRHARPLHT